MPREGGGDTMLVHNTAEMSLRGTSGSEVSAVSWMGAAADCAPPPRPPSPAAARTSQQRPVYHPRCVAVLPIAPFPAPRASLPTDPPAQLPSSAPALRLIPGPGRQCHRRRSCPQSSIILWPCQMWEICPRRSSLPHRIRGCPQSTGDEQVRLRLVRDRIPASGRTCDRFPCL